MGKAVGSLTLAGLRVYLYLAGNSNGAVWTINPATFAEWCGVDYNDSSTARKVRKWVTDGVKNLIEVGYLEEYNDKYVFREGRTGY